MGGIKSLSKRKGDESEDDIVDWILVAKKLSPKRDIVTCSLSINSIREDIRQQQKQNKRKKQRKRKRNKKARKEEKSEDERKEAKEGEIDRSRLNDEQINSYMEVLQGENEDSHFFHTKFMGFIVERDYDRVKQWTKRKRQTFDIFNMDKLYCPLNVNNTHWILVVIDMKGKTVTFFDSLGQCDNQHRFECVLEYLERMEPDFCRDGWEMICPGTRIPQQINSYDCGVYVCMYARHLSNGLDMEFGSNEVTKFRGEVLIHHPPRRIIHDDDDDDGGGVEYVRTEKNRDNDDDGGGGGGGGWW